METNKRNTSGLVGIAAGGLGIYSVADVAYGDNGGHYTDQSPVANVGETVGVATNSIFFDDSWSALPAGSEIAAVGKWRSTDTQVRTNSHIHLDHSPVTGEVTNMVWRYIHQTTVVNPIITSDVFGVSCQYNDGATSRPLDRVFTYGAGNTDGGETNILSVDGVNERTTAVNVPRYQGPFATKTFVGMATPNSTNTVSFIPEPSLTGLAMLGAMAYSFVRGRLNSKKPKQKAF